MASVFEALRARRAVSLTLAGWTAPPEPTAAVLDELHRRLRAWGRRLDAVTRPRHLLAFDPTRTSVGFRRRLRPWWGVLPRRRGGPRLLTGGVLYFAVIQSVPAGGGAWLDRRAGRA